MKRWLIFAIFCTAIPAFAERDFLTSDEVEKIREAQDPNDRLKLYVLLAKQRLDQLDRLLAKEKKGRSLQARELLGDYSKIIDAIDTVSDDALKRGVDISMGTAAVNTSEKAFATQLAKIRDKAPSDLDFYELELKEAISDTSDSLDLAKEDTTVRAARLTDEDKKLKEEAEQEIAAEDSKGKPTAGKDAQAKSEEPKTRRKAPTLMRPGEEKPKE